MEKKAFSETKSISRLFDLQRFAPNGRLASIINDVEYRYGTALSDEELAYVNAAGEADPMELSDNPPYGSEEDPL